MSFFTQRDFATLFLDGAAIVLMVILTIMSSEDRKRKREDDRYFLFILIVNCILSVADAVAYLFDMKTVPGSVGICISGMTVFYICYVLIMILWAHFCRVRFKDRGAASGGILRVEYIPGALMMVLIIVNIFTGWIFSYDENGVYHRGFLYMVVYLIIVLYAVVGFVYLGRYRGRNLSKRLVPVWLYVLPVVFGLVFSFAVSGSASFTAIGLAMAVTFTYMGTINESLNTSYGKRSK